MKTQSEIHKYIFKKKKNYQYKNIQHINSHNFDTQSKITRLLFLVKIE